MNGHRFDDALLMQFAKSPEPGRVKTRLEPALGPDGCARLHAALVRHTRDSLVASQLAPVALWYSGGQGGRAFFLDLVGRQQLHRQRGATLGDRMHNAFSDAFMQDPVRKAILVGSDCPHLDGVVLAQALEALDDGCEAVFGPATDGGYYLIGLSRPEPSLFLDIPWGTGEVMDETRKKLDQLRWRWHELPALGDIDEPGDLPLLEGIPGFEPFLANNNR